MDQLRRSLFHAEQATKACRFNCNKAALDLEHASERSNALLRTLTQMHRDACRQGTDPALSSSIRRAQHAHLEAVEVCEIANADIRATRAALAVAERIESEIRARVQLETERENAAYAAMQREQLRRSESAAQAHQAMRREQLRRAQSAAAHAQAQEVLRREQLRRSGSTAKTHQASGQAKSGERQRRQARTPPDVFGGAARHGQSQGGAPNPQRTGTRSKPTYAEHEAKRQRRQQEEASKQSRPPSIPHPIFAQSISAFHSAATSAFTDYTTLTSFPLPPFAPCGNLACARTAPTRALRACPCNIRAAFSVPSVNLKTARLQWHPDKFSRCPEHVRADFQKKAQEVFAVVQAMYEEGM